MSKREDAIKLGKINKQLHEINAEIEVIKAKITKEIWTGELYAEFTYNERTKLRNAELVLRLNGDNRYKELLSKYRELQAEAQQYWDIDMNIDEDGDD